MLLIVATVPDAATGAVSRCSQKVSPRELSTTWFTMVWFAGTRREPRGNPAHSTQEVLDRTEVFEDNDQEQPKVGGPLVRLGGDTERPEDVAPAAMLAARAEAAVH